ncbi:ParB N-terminal domain-containing protein [Enterobacter cloacae]|uniref:ParB N-terminal domain-containing protein n=1 Tax=Enterobacter cloacae TaxID=550 RepID=UPI00292CCB73|nr:ParB N-terminal domain-containing protein [Enterobacter cloacae]
MANSFKQMTRDGTIKRTDTGMFISLDDIHVREGFNIREDDERTRLANDDLFDYLMNGGVVPPIEVVPRDEGGVYIVEGHRRHLAYQRCRDAGKPVNRIHIMPFYGNDLKQKARIFTSASQLSLSPIDQINGIRDFAPFNLTPAEIAKEIHKSVAWVEKLIALSNANHDVQKAVKAGEISVDVAIDRVKEFGEKAGEVLQKDKASAAAKGKKKVTRSVIAPEISVKKARRLVELISLAGINDTGVISLEGLVHAEVVEIIDEHKAIATQRHGAAS